MFWIIIGIILLIAAFVGLGIQYFPDKYAEDASGYGRKKVQDEHYEWKVRPRQILCILTLLIMLPAFIAKVPANSVGIQYSPFNGTSETTLKEGFKFKNPLDKVYNISTQVQTAVIEGVTTQTMDAQYVTTILDVKYQVDPTNAFMVFKNYKTLENFSNSSVKSIVQKSLELVTTKYDVISILGNQRAEVYKEIEVTLATELAKEGITYKNIIINDMDAGAKIEAAIEAQAIAEKSVETAKAELEKTRTESQQKAVQAQADQDAARIKAETKIITAKGESEANDLMTKSLTPEVLQQMAIDKWDGKFPTTMAGDSSNLLFGIGASTVKE